ncbi:MAG: trypsin-like peptidase domain-containing protein, partial [Dehalococcoidia bacterium]|nr:trypsin-like peptidase domain-containing protein [Dehalococcoidia bacterium]
MLKKTILGIAVVFLMSIIALGIVSASPNSQAGTRHESVTFLILVIEDANDKGLLSDELNTNLYEHIIESLIVPYTFETPEEVEERLSEQGQTSFEILVSVLTDANDKGILSEYLIDTLTDLFVEELIASHTGETPEQITRRLSAQAVPTPTAVPSATPLPMTVGEVVKNVEKAVVLVESSDGIGTGFIIDAGGRLITNAHVVEREPRVLVHMHDETVYESDVLGIDELADLAVVQLPPG